MLRQVLGQMFKAKGAAPAPQAAVPAAEPAPPPGHDEAAKLDALIEHAASLAVDMLPEATRTRVDALARAFVPPAGRAPADLNVFVFHVEMGEAGKLQYRDIAMDVNRFDYAAVLQTFKRCVRRWHPRAHIFLATSRGSAFAGLADEALSVVELDLAADQPMYERVHAMCAYARSGAFTTDTLFLDSDAFVNADFGPYLEADFDIAITTRGSPGLMPVNEGVIVARAARPERVRGFFDRYLATYEALRVDERVVAHYGDIRKWRGGQLSLNAVTRAAHPFPAMRRIDVAGAAIQCLPCDPFNYSYEYGEKVHGATFNGKVIVHLKGGRKTSLRDWEVFSGALTDAPTTPFVEPHFALWNKEYREHPFTDKAVREKFVGHLQAAAALIGANTPHGHALLADDLFVWFLSVQFLQDPAFVAAMGPLFDDATLRARIWRVYALCWAAKSCMSLEGDFLDVGCYDGKTVSVIDRYCDFASQRQKTYWLFDMFENPPEESRKGGHGPQLFDHVKAMFSESPQFRVIKGPVPDTFEGNLPDKVAFAQIDLNAAEPELAALDRIFDRIVPGGMIVFDDFGFSRYHRTRELEEEFMARHGVTVFESPTGQGFFIKR